MNPVEKYLLNSNKNKIKIYSENYDVINHFNKKESYADHIINDINTDRLYDIFLINIKKKDLIVLDLGANIGLFSLYIQERCKMVYSVEPTPSHFQILNELTDKYTNIIPLELALDNEDEEISFYLCDVNSTMNTTIKQSRDIYNESITVKAIRLETLINELRLNKIDLVNCDIEGSEIIILNDDTIFNIKDIVDNWFIKIRQIDNCTIEENRDKIKNIFEKNNYNVIYYGNETIYAYKD